MPFAFSHSASPAARRSSAGLCPAFVHRSLPLAGSTIARNAVAYFSGGVLWWRSLPTCSQIRSGESAPSSGSAESASSDAVRSEAATPLPETSATKRARLVPSPRMSAL